MSLAVDAAPLYARTLDRSLGSAGEEVRSSIERAIERMDGDRWAKALRSMSDALEKSHREDGTLVQEEPFGRVCDVLSVLPRNVPVPVIVVESEREIGLDWHTDSRHVLSLTIDGSTYIGYAALVGHESVHGRVPFSGSLPRTITDLLARIYPRGTCS